MLESTDNQTADEASSTQADGPESNDLAASTTVAESSASTVTPAATLEDTLKPPENQGKPADRMPIPTDPPSRGLAGRLADRQQEFTALLREKEGLQLTHVLAKTPRAYYLRWKTEANQLFSMNVDLKRRRARLKSVA